MERSIPLDRINYNPQGVRTINPVEGGIDDETRGKWKKVVKEYNKPGTVEGWFGQRERCRDILNEWNGKYGKRYFSNKFNL